MLSPKYLKLLLHFNSNFHAGSEQIMVPSMPQITATRKGLELNFIVTLSNVILIQGREKVFLIDSLKYITQTIAKLCALNKFVQDSGNSLVTIPFCIKLVS